MLYLLRFPILLSQVNLERPPKQLEQHLEARLGDRRVITPLGQLIADERVLSPREFVERKHHTGVAEFLANEITASIVDVGVFDAEDEADFAFELGEEVDCVSGVWGGGV